ncbi:MAG: hypothetical protein DGJ47_001120 [Rickettsiaceae bacterium]
MSKNKQIGNLKMPIIGLGANIEQSENSITPRTFKGQDLCTFDCSSIPNIINKFIIRCQEQLADILKTYNTCLEQIKTLNESGMVSNSDYSQFFNTNQLQSNIGTSKERLKHFEKYQNIINRLEYPKNASFLVKKYQCRSDQTILEYTFNSNNLHFNIEQFNSFLLDFDDGFEQNSSIGSSKKSGSKKSNRSEKKQQFFTKKLLHPLEIMMLNQAIAEVNNNSKPVVTNIFARNDDGQIKYSDNNEPEVHAIVLYKLDNMSGEILVIDPNNSTFSNHLATGFSNILLSNTGENSNQLVAPNHIIKIYSPLEGKKTGPNNDQSRDCIDIAVKLVDEIINMEEGLNDPRKLAEWQPIIHISNNDVIDSSIILDLEQNKLPLRNKQSSDQNIRKSFCNIQNNVQILLNMLLKINLESYDEYLNKYASVLFNTDDHKAMSQFLDELKHNISTNTNSIVDNIKLCVLEGQKSSDEIIEISGEVE